MTQTKLVHNIGVPAGEVGNNDIILTKPSEDLLGYFPGASQPVSPHGRQPDCAASRQDHLFENLDSLFIPLTAGRSGGFEPVPDRTNYEAA
jgi:hypothetical protein